MKRKHFIQVQGHRNQWAFNVLLDPKHLAEVQRDGIEIFEMGNSIPAWIAAIGLARPWCFFQDLFHFKNPLKNTSSRFRL